MDYTWFASLPQTPQTSGELSIRGEAMRLRRIGPILLLVLSSAGVVAQDPTDKPRFRAGVELIQLDVAVLDDKRQPVRGLTAADFIALDNGVAKPVRAFTPIKLAARGNGVWGIQGGKRR